jgi:(p)ppGpp synthase/HD superfamily hydrolase
MSKVQGPINHKAVIAACQKHKPLQLALELAKKLYKKDKRKHTGIEYLSHPLTVISLLLEVGASQDALVVAALQDTLSRTTLKESTIRAQFGDDVADNVVALAPVSSQGAFGILDTIAFAAYKDRLASASPEVQTIALASILDHICSIPAAKLSDEAAFVSECADVAGALVLGNAEIARRVQAALRRARA